MDLLFLDRTERHTKGAAATRIRLMGNMARLGKSVNLITPI
jgi:hypothetical protein